ncbi:MAG: lactate utilization protein [Clostridiales bacterium]|nr:lactate utilization protein [Clostridiales bacterium]
MMEQTLERMRRNGFEIVELDTKEQARDYLLGVIPDGSSVGVSGTVSVREVGILPMLQMRGCEIFSHWDVPAEEKPETHQKAHGADVYLTSANALTRRGELVLVDGVGNRVASVANGPRRVYFVVSRSKWVDGGYGKAIARIRKDACPRNAYRQNADTPCRTGICDPDACMDDTMCRMTLVLDKVPKDRKMTLVFVKENLGY